MSADPNAEPTYGKCLHCGSVEVALVNGVAGPCQFGQHPGGNHSWAGPDDIIHALRTGQPDPANQKCGCDCTDGPELAPAEPDYDEIPFSDLEPCPICDATGPCGYDAEGRPMVHTDAFDDDTDGDQVYRPIEDVPTGGLV